jgi:nucleoside-diphosphate-sugar epimerase
MRVFVAGSTGVVRKNLLPLLLEGAHEVVALVRTAQKGKQVEALGAQLVVADALDKDALTAAIRKARPEVLPWLADVLGAKPPRKVLVWLTRLLIGDGGVSMMTQIRGASNAKANREFGWEPIYPSWRCGFIDGTWLALTLNEVTKV